MLYFSDNGPCGGQCNSYTVTADSVLDLAGLFNAIREARPHDNHGKLYIKLDGAVPASAAHHNVRYAYDDGIFHLDRNKRQGEPAAKAPDDILERIVTQVSAHGGWGRMDYFINLQPPAAARENQGES